MTDDRDPKDGGPGRTPGSEREITEAAHGPSDFDARVRALRNAPVDADTMARMRAGLAQRIEASAPVEPSPISSHPRWRRWAGPVAAALAAGLALFFLSRVPRPGSEATRPPPSDDTTASIAIPGEAPTSPGPVAPGTPVDVVSDEALAIAVEYELLSDYEVIAQLDLLELLDEMPDAGEPQRGTSEGRI